MSHRLDSYRVGGRPWQLCLDCLMTVSPTGERSEPMGIAWCSVAWGIVHRPWRTLRWIARQCAALVRGIVGRVA